jgi:regulator of nonsense transcripts 3
MSSATIEPPKKSRSKPKDKRQAQTKASGSERLKTVVRRLPPNLPEHIFWQSVQTWVTDDTVLWKEYYPGKVKKKLVPDTLVVNSVALSCIIIAHAVSRLNKENVHSRAYIAFKTEEFVAKFSHEYDGHIFKDKAGQIFSRHFLSILGLIIP